MTEAMAPRFDCIVLGAGPAGLVAAHDLAKDGRRVLVVDSQAAVQGSHRSCDIGPYTFDNGSIYYDRSGPFLARFPAMAARCLPVARSIRRLTPQGDILPYPFSGTELRSWPVHKLARAAASYLEAQVRPRPGANVEELSVNRVGRFFYAESGLEAYVERMFGVPADQLSPRLFQDRMRFLSQPSLNVLFNASMSRRPPEPGATQGLCIRPREGFEDLFRTARESLESCGVVFRLGASFSDPDFEEGRVALTVAGERILATRVICAMPVDRLYREVTGQAAALPSRDLLTLFISAGERRGDTGQVLYNFTRRGRWKRVTFHSDYYGLAGGRHYLSVEITLAPTREDETTPESGFADFEEHLVRDRRVLEDLRFEGSLVTPDAYPVQTVEAIASAEEMIAVLRERGVICVGRQGRFVYLPTASVVARRTAELLEDELKGPVRRG